MTALRTLPARFALLLIALAAPAGAQQYGQWSWSGQAGGNLRRFETIEEKGVSAPYSDQSLQGLFGVSLTGFIIDPIIARFDIGADVGTTRNMSRGTAGGHEKVLGFNGALGLLPRSPYPTQLSFFRGQYDFIDFVDSSPDQAASQRETMTNWKWLTRIERGLGSGTILGLEQTRTSGRAGQGGYTLSNGFAQWNGDGHFEKLVRLDALQRDYTSLHYSQSDYTGTFRESGPIGDLWKMNLGTIAARSELTAQNGHFSGDRLQAYYSMTRPLGETKELALHYDGGLYTVAGGSGVSQGHAISALSSWRASENWTMTSTASIAFQSAESRTAVLPRTGLSIGWHHAVGPMQLQASGGASYYASQTRDHGVAASETGAGYGGGFGVSHGGSDGFQKSLDVSYYANQTRLSGDEFSDIPGSGAQLAGTGTEDIANAQVGLYKSWRQADVSVRGSVEERNSSGKIVVRPMKSSAMRGTVQTNFRIVDMALGGGKTEIESGVRQTVTYVSGGASLFIWRGVTLNGKYRADRRLVVLAPSIDSKRYEFGGSMALGRVAINAQLYRSWQSVDGGPERSDRGLIVSVVRGFNGWLPIVSTPQRRGVVR